MAPVRTRGVPEGEAAGATVSDGSENHARVEVEVMKSLQQYVFPNPWFLVHGDAADGAGAGGGADGAGAGGGADGAGAGGGADGAGAGGGADDPKKPKVFTQEQVNKIVAEDRRKLQKQVETTVGELERLKKSKGLSDKEKGELQGRIEELQNSLLTKEELTVKEREKLQGEHKRQVESLTDERDTWQKRYVESTITRTITDEASRAEAYNPGQIVALLRGTTRLVEVLDADGNPIPDEFVAKVHFADSDKEGKPLTLDLTVAEALKRMKDREDFANLFKSGVSGGIGGSGNRGSGTRVDPGKMTPEQWQKYRKEIGLGRKR